MTAVQPGVAPSSPSKATTERDWTTTCLNCGSSLSGPFCAECGQRAAPPHPTLRELGGEAFAELSGWDGKVAETLRALLRRPGKLTLEFLEGRRARYVSPLRLYLTCSVIYFLVAASVPPRFRSGIVVTPGITLSTGRSSIVDAEKGTNLTEEDRREIARAVNKAPRVIRPLMARISGDAQAFQLQMRAAMPKALLALLPVFAAILTIFFRKRHFSEHLYFAFHLHAFFFVGLALATAVRYLRWNTGEIIAGILVLFWLPVYAHLSFRRVYQNSAGKTIAKEIGIAALYAAAALPTVVLLAIWVAAH